MKQLKNKIKWIGVFIIVYILSCVCINWHNSKIKVTKENVTTTVQSCEEVLETSLNLLQMPGSSTFNYNISYKITVDIDGSKYVVKRYEQYKEGQTINVKKITKKYSNHIETIVE